MQLASRLKSAATSMWLPLSSVMVLVLFGLDKARSIQWTPFKILLAVVVAVAPGGVLLCPLLFKKQALPAHPPPAAVA